MQQFIYRKKAAKQYIYTTNDFPTLTVTAKSTFAGLLQGRLSLYDKEKELYLLRQKNFLKQILVNLPIPGRFLFNPFLIFQHGVFVGQVKRLQYGFSFPFGDAIFELRAHSGLIFSVMENEEQIAVFQRVADAKYSMEYNEKAENQLGIFLLCCAFCDSKYFVDQGSIITNVMANDAYSDRAKWKP